MNDAFDFDEHNSSSSGSEDEEEEEEDDHEETRVKPLHVLSRLCVADVAGPRLATRDGVLSRTALQSALDAAESTAAWTAQALDAALTALRTDLAQRPRLLAGDALCRAAAAAAVRRHAATVSRDPRKLHCVAVLAAAWLAPALRRTRAALLAAPHAPGVLRLCCARCCTCPAVPARRVPLLPAPVPTSSSDSSSSSSSSSAVLVLPAGAYLDAVRTALAGTRDADEERLALGAGTLWAALRRAVADGLAATLRQLDRTRLALAAAAPPVPPASAPVCAAQRVRTEDDEYRDFAEVDSVPVPAAAATAAEAASTSEKEDDNQEDEEEDEDEGDEGTETQRFVARFRRACAREPQRWRTHTLAVPPGYFDGGSAHPASLLGQHLTPDAVNSAPRAAAQHSRDGDACDGDACDGDVSWWRPGRFIHERSLQPVARADVLIAGRSDDAADTRALRAALLSARLAAHGCTDATHAAFFRLWHEATAAAAPNMQCARAALPARVTALASALRAPDVPPDVRALFAPFLLFLLEDGHLALDTYLRLLVAFVSES